jgi:hypothetical protein
MVPADFSLMADVPPCLVHCGREAVCNRSVGQLLSSKLLPEVAYSTSLVEIGPHVDDDSSGSSSSLRSVVSNDDAVHARVDLKLP